MKNIAIVCYDMVPYTRNWGGSQRVWNYANLLSEENTVYVISSKNTEREAIIDKPCKFTNIPIGNIGGSQETVLDQVRGKNIKGWVLAKARKIYKHLDHVITNDPVKGMGFYAHAWINRIDILHFVIKKRIDTLIFSVPPFGLLSPSILKQISNMNIKLIVDYRDPWNCWNGREGIAFSREKKCISLCDAIVVTNENHKNRLSKDFGINKDRIHIISNGYDENVWSKIEDYISPKHEKMVISYLGSISLEKGGMRDMSLFLKALDRFEHKENVIFRIVGTDKQKEQINDYFNVSIPNIETIPIVQQIESFKYMLQSDVLMNLHTVDDKSANFLIAGKIFDYFHSGKQILSINSNESLEHSFVINNGCGYVVNNDYYKIATIISTIYDDWVNSNGQLPQYDNSGNLYSRQYQNTKWISIV